MPCSFNDYKVFSFISLKQRSKNEAPARLAALPVYIL
jgi:hypothetical protein